MFSVQLFKKVIVQDRFGDHVQEVRVATEACPIRGACPRMPLRSALSPGPNHACMATAICRVLLNPENGVNLLSLLLPTGALQRASVHHWTKGGGAARGCGGQG